MNLPNHQNAAEFLNTHAQTMMEDLPMKLHRHLPELLVRYAEHFLAAYQEENKPIQIKDIVFSNQCNACNAAQDDAINAIKGITCTVKLVIQHTCTLHPLFYKTSALEAQHAAERAEILRATKLFSESLNNNQTKAK